MNKRRMILGVITVCSISAVVIYSAYMYKKIYNVDYKYKFLISQDKDQDLNKERIIKYFNQNKNDLQKLADYSSVMQYRMILSNQNYKKELENMNYGFDNILKGVDFKILMLDTNNLSIVVSDYMGQGTAITRRGYQYEKKSPFYNEYGFNMKVDTIELGANWVYYNWKYEKIKDGDIFKKIAYDSLDENNKSKLNMDKSTVALVDLNSLLEHEGVKSNKKNDYYIKVNFYNDDSVINKTIFINPRGNKIISLNELSGSK